MTIIGGGSVAVMSQSVPLKFRIITVRTGATIGLTIVQTNWPMHWGCNMKVIYRDAAAWGTGGEVGRHVLEPTESELQQIVERAEADLFPAVYVYTSQGHARLFKMADYQRTGRSAIDTIRERVTAERRAMLTDDRVRIARQTRRRA